MAKNYSSMSALEKRYVNLTAAAEEAAWEYDDLDRAAVYSKAAWCAYRVLEAIRLYQAREYLINRADALVISQENFLLGYSHRR